MLDIILVYTALAINITGYIAYRLSKKYGWSVAVPTAMALLVGLLFIGYRMAFQPHPISELETSTAVLRIYMDSDSDETGMVYARITDKISGAKAKQPLTEGFITRIDFRIMALGENRFRIYELSAKKSWLVNVKNPITVSEIPGQDLTKNWTLTELICWARRLTAG